jgi:hypothetical protein
MNYRERITELAGRIKKALFRERVLFLGVGIIALLAALTAIIIVLSILAGIFILPVGVKISLLVISALGLIYLFWKLAIRPLLAGNLESTALKLEKKFPELKGRLIAALQFSQIADSKAIGFSDDLILATLAQAEEKGRPLNFNEIIPVYPVWRGLRNLSFLILTAVLLLVLFPGLFSFSYEVYSRPAEVVTPPLGYILTPCPGDATAIKYRDIDIGAILQGDKIPDKASIYFRFIDGNWQKTDIDLKKLTFYPSSHGDSALVMTTIKQARRPFDYYVKAGRITTPTAHIEVVDRPRVTGIKLSMFYPEYTGLSPVVVDENDGNIAAVMGTRVTIKIETNLPVVRAEMRFDDSSLAPFELNGQTGEQSLRVDKDRRYLIHLVDNQGEENPDPIEYRITAIPDEYPIVDVVRPGVDVNLGEDMLVPLLLRISDDYGFSSLVLKYNHISGGQKDEEKVAVLHFSDKIKTEGEINFNWDLEPMRMQPSDYILYHFELADNDRISGPKVTVSRQYIARLPSLEEIISQSEQEQGANIDRAEDALKSQRELAERLQNVIKKIEQDKSQSGQKMSWQNQKELQDIADKDAQTAQELKEAAQKMEEMLKKMEENRLASREILEKLNEIKKLFDEVATEEMKEARLKLLEALKKMNQSELDKAIKDYKMTREDMMQRLERTIALLKKMKIEQKVNAMTELAKEMAGEQEKINQNTEQAENSNLPNLAPEEEKLGDKMNNLKNQAKELREMLKETPYRKAREADQFCQAVENNDADQNMDNMTAELNKKAKEPALNEGKTSLSKLMTLVSKMQEGQAGMCNGSSGEMSEKMRAAIDDINYLGDQEEGLILKAREMANESEVLRDMAAQQQVIKESMAGFQGRVIEMGKESPFIAAEFFGLIQDVMNNLEAAVNKFSDRRGYEAQNFQREALYGLNRTAVRMLDALEKESKCNKGGSCNKPTQKLSAMCDQQKQINEQTQSQCQNPNGLGDKESLRRLAAQQEGLRKSLSELEREFGQSKEVLGRLDAITDDMKKVADQLDNGQVGEETLERQLKIYSRMLDAARTMQRKDYTEQRRAESGKDIIRNSPPSLSGDQLQGGVDIDDRLRQFLNEKYPQEYGEHIKAYFKALMEKIDNLAPQGK